MKPKTKRAAVSLPSRRSWIRRWRPTRRNKKAASQHEAHRAVCLFRWAVRCGRATRRCTALLSSDNVPNEAPMSLLGPSRHFAAKQRFGRFRREADID
jgi:hypothetical protein